MVLDMQSVRDSPVATGTTCGQLIQEQVPAAGELTWLHLRV